MDVVDDMFVFDCAKTLFVDWVLGWDFESFCGGPGAFGFFVIDSGPEVLVFELYVLFTELPDELALESVLIMLIEKKNNCYGQFLIDSNTDKWLNLLCARWERCTLACCVYAAYH